MMLHVEEIPCFKILMSTRVLMMDLYVCAVMYVKSFAHVRTVLIITYLSLSSQIQKNNFKKNSHSFITFFFQDNIFFF